MVKLNTKMSYKVDLTVREIEKDERSRIQFFIKKINN